MLERILDRLPAYIRHRVSHLDWPYSATTLFVIAFVAIATILFITRKSVQGHEWLEGVHVEATGFLFDILLFGILLTLYEQWKSRCDRIERYKEEIDDYRGWNEKEAGFRIVGSIRRLSKLNASKELNLRNCYLRGANLNNTNLTCANLCKCNLLRANLCNVNLTGAYLVGTNLTYADLSGADLTNALLVYTTFTGANLGGTNLTYADLSGADLTDARFFLSCLTEANLTEANLRRAEICHVNLTKANLTSTDLTEANLTGTWLTGATIERSQLTDEQYHSLKFWKDGNPPS